MCRFQAIEIFHNIKPKKMKKLTRMSLFGLLATGLLVSCGKEKEEKPVDPDYTAGADYTVTTFGLNMEMVYVEGGSFEMGATAEQGEDARGDEYPVRTVKLDSYHIGKYEVTQGQWEAVMGTSLEEQRAGATYDHGIVGEGADYPMYYVSWNEAQEFCKRLSKKTGKKYVLPTEAQWEYAARGGNKSKGYKYSGSNDIEEVAWYNYNSDKQTHRVGTKKANELGIYDMSGNVLEWCSDWWAYPYDEDDTDNPQGPVNGSERVARGGSWNHDAIACRVAIRFDAPPGDRYGTLGFRVACLP